VKREAVQALDDAPPAPPEPRRIEQRDDVVGDMLGEGGRPIINPPTNRRVRWSGKRDLNIVEGV